MGLDVIYGDTDSIMINTNRFDLDEVYTLAKKVKNEVNKKYSTLELDIDGVFRKLLLLKKKKYAGLLIERNTQQKVVYTKQIKGLDIIRRDWSIISIESGEYVLNEILSERGLDEILDNIHQFLSNLGQEIRNGNVPREKYVIKKQLAKAPKDYGDKISQPHVTVALRLNEKGRKFKQGDVISYVICQDGTNNSAVQRAYDLSEMEENSKLIIDSHYYLSQQIHPVVSRLCEVIDGTDAVRIAECLGMGISDSAYEYDWSTLFNPKDCDSYCSPFDFQCTNPECNTINEIDSIFRGKASSIEFSLGKCKNENCAVKPLDFTFLLANRLRLLIFRLIEKYYANWMICDDITCNYRTRKISFKIDKGQIICPSCKRNILKQEINEKMLFDQLTYFQRIFDIDTALSQISAEELATLQPKLKDINDTCNQLHNVVREFLELNNYSQVDLGKLFSGQFSAILGWKYNPKPKHFGRNTDERGS
uniref:DNA-directed DNA polymerase n=1 Tax=Romanomermis culicivorax TaxID=13658 RepID=A0A915KY41_ROMCU